MKEIPGVVSRMEVELCELIAKLTRAESFLATETFKHLPDEEREVFADQVQHMAGYRDALSKRLGMVRTRLDI